MRLESRTFCNVSIVDIFLSAVSHQSFSPGYLMDIWVDLCTYSQCIFYS
uniref:Uncharacterized protein n=1 Tax=Anguilla anguilla TaxID=7936 RepID=A0A0E9SHU0_ANGAN